MKKTMNFWTIQLYGDKILIRLAIQQENKYRVPQA